MNMKGTKYMVFRMYIPFHDINVWKRIQKLWYNARLPYGKKLFLSVTDVSEAMVYGNPLQEVYQLNEESIWSGYPQDWNNPKAANALPQVREAVDRGDYAKTSELWKANAQGPYTARYLPMAKPDARPTDAGSPESVS